MLLRRHVFFCALLLLLFFSSALAQNVRVLLADIGPSHTVVMSGAHRGYINGQLKFSAALGLSWPLSVAGGQIYIDGQPVGRTFRLEPTDGVVYWDGKPYRGALGFMANSQGLTVVNVLDLESYLRGVVPVEMVAASWPLEALKAQAVAARSYALQRLGSSEAYDVCGTQACQEYGGISVEHPRSDQAVAETAGLVVTYGGNYARTVYHADSGGAVASAEEVWGGAFPYLVSMRDVDGRTPHRSWQLALEPSQLAASLAARGHNVGTVSALRPTSYSASGRVAAAEIAGSAGSVQLSGSQLQSLLREVGMKSTRFNMTGPLAAQGSGWGHGVGMSQYGARALAEAGYSHLQILAFYYPNTEFQRHVFGG